MVGRDRSTTSTFPPHQWHHLPNARPVPSRVNWWSTAATYLPSRAVNVFDGATDTVELDPRGALRAHWDGVR